MKTISSLSFSSLLPAYLSTSKSFRNAIISGNREVHFLYLQIGYNKMHALSIMSNSSIYFLCNLSNLMNFATQVTCELYFEIVQYFIVEFRKRGQWVRNCNKVYMHIIIKNWLCNATRVAGISNGHATSAQKDFYSRKGKHGQLISMKNHYFIYTYQLPIVPDYFLTNYLSKVTLSPYLGNFCGNFHYQLK